MRVRLYYLGDPAGLYRFRARLRSWLLDFLAFCVQVRWNPLHPKAAVRERKVPMDDDHLLRPRDRDHLAYSAFLLLLLVSIQDASTRYHLVELTQVLVPWQVRDCELFALSSFVQDLPY